MVSIKIIMPSCGIKSKVEEQTITDGVNLLTSWGMQVSMPEHIWHNEDVTTMDARREQSLLHNAGFEVLMALRGGYGASRLLHTKTDQPWILEGQRLVGYSDVTSLFGYAAQQGAQVAHGPTLSTLSLEPNWSQARMRLWLEAKPLEFIQGIGIKSGVGHGKLWAGNLTVLCHLLGTPYMPDLNQALLVCEDINEPLYKIDRLLNHLRLAGALDKLSGLGLGRFDRNQDPSLHHEIESLVLRHVNQCDFPVVSRLPMGHGCLSNAVMPLNQAATIDGTRGLVTINQEEPTQTIVCSQ